MGRQQRVLTGSTCSAASVPTRTQQHLETPSTEMPPAHTSTFQPAVQLCAVLSPGQMQQGFCLKDDRAHLRFPIKVVQLEGVEHLSAMRGSSSTVSSALPCSLRDRPLSSNDRAGREQRTSKNHMDIEGPCSHRFLLRLVLSWGPRRVCVFVVGDIGGQRRESEC